VKDYERMMVTGERCGCEKYRWLSGRRLLEKKKTSYLQVSMYTETVFLNFQWAQVSIPRNKFRQPMQP